MAATSPTNVIRCAATPRSPRNHEAPETTKPPNRRVRGLRSRFVEMLARHSRAASTLDGVRQLVERAGQRRTPEPERNRLHSLEDRLSETTVARIVADYQRGVPSTHLARSLGVGKAGVLGILRDHGVQLRMRPMTDHEVKEAVRLYEQGWSLARVGRQLGRDHSAIRDSLERTGVPRRDSHGRARLEE